VDEKRVKLFESQKGERKILKVVVHWMIAMIFFVPTILVYKSVT